MISCEKTGDSHLPTHACQVCAHYEIRAPTITLFKLSGVFAFQCFGIGFHVWLQPKDLCFYKIYSQKCESSVCVLIYCVTEDA